MIQNDRHAVSVLLDALDSLCDARLTSRELRTILLGTKVDSAELAAEVREVARALDGVLRLDAGAFADSRAPHRARTTRE